MEKTETQILNERLKTLNQEINGRMANIDARLEKLVEVVAVQTQVLKQIDDHESRLRDLESVARKNSFVTSGALKFMGWLAAGAIGFGFLLLKR